MLILCPWAIYVPGVSKPEDKFYDTVSTIDTFFLLTPDIVMKNKKHHAAAPGFGLPEDKVQPTPKSLDAYRNTASSPAFGSSMEGFQGKRKTK